MRKKTKLFIVGSAIMLLVAMCLSCAVPVPLILPIVEVPKVIPSTSEFI